MERKGVCPVDSEEEARLTKVATHIDHAEPLPPPDLGVPVGPFAEAIDALSEHFGTPTTIAGIA